MRRIKTQKSVGTVKGRTGYVPLRDGLSMAEAARVTAKVSGTMYPATVYITTPDDPDVASVAVHIGSDGKARVTGKEYRGAAEWED